MTFVALLSLHLVVLSASSLANSLSLNYNEKTCPDVEVIVAKAVTSATMKDKTVPATLLRMHFHDCFIRVIGIDFRDHLLSCFRELFYTFE